MDARITPDGAFVVVLPVKPPARGKSRLQRGLPDQGRRDLAEAFALDTAAACLASARVRAVLAVTDDAAFASRLGALGCAAIPDGDGSGLNAALRQGVAEAVRRWPDAQPVALLADLPALRPGDLDAALDALVPGGPSYVADADGTGTVLYTAPHDQFDPAFGEGSARAHEVGGALAVRGDLASLRRDVDDVEDLVTALAIGVGPETLRRVAELDLPTG
ncbi:2-phospho-L-lactate guanylyltransferase [Nocardioides dongxiaopingii]|uniref:2-phospho-L-lactate guanylyltransferase n=1 Tax=Nocardioides TaxID=1839 RepID=UPI001FEBE523|nr:MULTISPECIES: 2-phospho-L-lactate guanylyltransferase [Nocardioides]